MARALRPAIELPILQDLRVDLYRDPEDAEIGEQDQQVDDEHAHQRIASGGLSEPEQRRWTLPAPTVWTARALTGSVMVWRLSFPSARMGTSRLHHAHRAVTATAPRRVGRAKARGRRRVCRRR